MRWVVKPRQTKVGRGWHDSSESHSEVSVKEHYLAEKVFVA